MLFAVIVDVSFDTQKILESRTAYQSWLRYVQCLADHQTSIQEKAYHRRMEL